MKRSNKIGALIFCLLGVFTLMSIIGDYNVTVLSTSINDANENYEEKELNVTFEKDKENNQVIVEAYDVEKFENITIDNTTVFDYEITFNNRNSKVDYTFYIENNSSNDAILQDYELPNPVCKGFHDECEKYLQGLTYRLMYESGAPLVGGDVIKAHSRVKVILSLEYKVNEKLLPSSTVDITNLGFDLSFKAK